MKIAILALQGAFAEHQQMLQSLGVDSFLIRNRDDWEREKDGLIIPGGESTSMIRILRDEKLLSPIKEAVQDGLPVFGTCAGMILLAKQVTNDSEQVASEGLERIATMDIVVRRNAYGRQLGSFHALHDFADIGKIPMTFIRAPYIEKVEKDVEILSTLDGNIVAARQGNQLACSFHPELTADTHVHEYFLKLIATLNT